MQLKELQFPISMLPYILYTHHVFLSRYVKISLKGNLFKNYFLRNIYQKYFVNIKIYTKIFHNNLQHQIEKLLYTNTIKNKMFKQS